MQRGADNGGTKISLTSYLGVEGDGLACGGHLSIYGVDEALSCRVESVMLHKLADTNGVAVGATARGKRCGHADSKREREDEREDFFHFFISLIFYNYTVDREN